MIQSLIFFGIAHAVSFLYFFIVLTRVKYFTNPYSFHETTETKLFGFLTLRIISFIYFATLLFAVFVHLLLLFAL